MPSICRIDIYPLKSFDPIPVSECRVLANGALEHDRQFALVDSGGRFVNAKRRSEVHRVRVLLDPQARRMTVQRRHDQFAIEFDLDAQRNDLEHWFSSYFSTSVTLVENTEGGFPDDGEATGPTIISTSSLESVSDWFPGLTLQETRLRFRANLEIAHVAPFWEDCLIHAASVGDRPFRIGSVVFGGSNPCQRCAVPTRDPATGILWPEFAKRFGELRQATLPRWAATDRFDHYYRLSVNTRLINAGSGVIRVGDHVELVN